MQHTSVILHETLNVFSNSDDSNGGKPDASKAQLQCDVYSLLLIPLNVGFESSLSSGFNHPSRNADTEPLKIRKKNPLQSSRASGHVVFCIGVL